MLPRKAQAQPKIELEKPQAEQSQATPTDSPPNGSAVKASAECVKNLSGPGGPSKEIALKEYSDLNFQRRAHEIAEALKAENPPYEASPINDEPVIYSFISRLTRTLADAATHRWQLSSQAKFMSSPLSTQLITMTSPKQLITCFPELESVIDGYIQRLQQKRETQNKAIKEYAQRQQEQSSQPSAGPEPSKQLPDCSTALYALYATMGEEFIRAFNYPETQRSIHEIAERLKDADLPLTTEQFYTFIPKLNAEIGEKLLILGREHRGEELGNDLAHASNAMKSSGLAWTGLAACFPELQPILTGYVQRLQAKLQQQKQDQEAAQAAREAERESAYAKRKEALNATGYQLLSINDFLLDGRELASRQAKVALQGTYAREGNIDVLYASVQDMAMSQHGGSNTQPRVPILTDDASRPLRQIMLQCQSTGAYFQKLGCAFAVKGRATTCSVSNAFGVTRQEPCVAAEDSWASIPENHKPAEQTKDNVPPQNSRYACDQQWAAQPNGSPDDYAKFLHDCLNPDR